jgi:predicted Zn-dependent protease
MEKTSCRASCRALIVARSLVFMLPIALPGCASAGSISEEQEIQLGRESAPQFEKQFGGVYPDQGVQRYVDKVGHSIVTFAGRHELPWRFRVLNSDQVNAFALPGGFVYITQGLLFRLENEAELAAILGHETGHVERKHSLQQIARAQNAQLLPALAGIFGGSTVGDIASVVSQLSLMKYSRNQEKEADLEGLKYIARAGYDPRGMVDAMRVLEKSGGSAPPEFLSTHPDPGNRIEYLTDAIQKDYPDRAGEGIVGDRSFEQNVLARRR